MNNNELLQWEKLQAWIQEHKDKEVWIPAFGFEGFYDISNQGRYRSYMNSGGSRYRNEYRRGNGAILNTEPRILKEGSHVSMSLPLNNDTNMNGYSKTVSMIKDYYWLEDALSRDTYYKATEHNNIRSWCASLKTHKAVMFCFNHYENNTIQTGITMEEWNNSSEAMKEHVKGGLEIDHINGNHNDNRLHNLRYVKGSRENNRLYHNEQKHLSKAYTIPNYELEATEPEPSIEDKLRDRIAKERVSL